MSYVFISPNYRVTQCPTTDRGMGFVGPDQPWSAENAFKFITEETTPCPPSKERKMGTGSNPPKRIFNHRMTPDLECVRTGRIREARKAGFARGVEYCCPKRVKPPKRVVTRQNEEDHLARCTPVQDERTGKTYDRELRWFHLEHYMPSTCEPLLGVVDNDYQLACCRKRDRVSAIEIGDMTLRTDAPTVAQIEAHEEALRQRSAEIEQVLYESAEPEYGFFERYGTALWIVGGAVGLGVGAALVRRTLKKRGEEK